MSTGKSCACGRAGKLFVAWTSDDRRNGGPHGDALLCEGCGAAVLAVMTGPAVPTLAELERETIRRALELTAGNITEAARVLGVHRSRVYRRLQKPDDPNAGELASLRAFRDAARRNGVALK